jgi:hypothetical protein
MISTTQSKRNLFAPAQASAVLGRFWATSKIMTIFFYASLAFLAIGLLGILFDPRTILGQPAWAKSTKFALSFVLYAPTMLWMFSYIKARPRLIRFVLDGCGAMLLLEMALLIVQAARGQAMHFNISTPLNSTLWGIMSVSIFIFYAISIVGFIVFLRQKTVPDRAFMWSLRLGMALMLLGFGLGFLMTGPTTDQMAVLQAGGHLDMMGAHTVGAADGGPGLTFLGWSTTHGDLRIAHFIGIHGAQVMALVGWLLLIGSAGRTRFLSAGHRLALVWGVAVAYLGLVGSVAWQALRDQPLLKPDALTLGVWAGLLAGIVLYSTAVGLHARRVRS